MALLKSPRRSIDSATGDCYAQGMRGILLITSLLITMFSLVSTTEAHHPGVRLDNDSTTQEYIKYAYKFYGQPQGCSHAVIGVPPNPLGPGVAWADQPGCAIWIAPDTVPWAETQSSFSRRQRLFAYCGTIMHEVGHNLGLGHVHGTAETPMNVDTGWTHPGCWAPKHVLHRHKHRHRQRIHGKVRTRMHFHKHYHLKVGQA